MPVRAFSIPNPAVRHNLECLERYSQLDHSLDGRQLDGLLASVIEIHSILPPKIKRLIPIARCYTHGRHWDLAPELCDALWAKVRADLSSGLDTILRSQHELDETALSDRPQTQGERIQALLVRWRAGEDQAFLAKQLENAGSGSDVAFEAKELFHLVSKKRIADASAHAHSVARLIHRIEAVASRLHHRS